MYVEMDFDDWYPKVKAEFEKNEITLPDDIELMQLAHMECRVDEKSIDEFIQDMIKEQKG